MIQYLASKHSIPAHKIYLIGLGKDKPVEPNTTRDGRAKNRRVDVRLMTNSATARLRRSSQRRQQPRLRRLCKDFPKEFYTPAAPRPPWSSFF